MTKNINHIEDRLEEDRAHLRATINELEERLSPGRILEEAARRFGGGSKDFATNLADDVRHQPLPALMTAAGALWFMAGSGRDRTGQSDSGNRRSDHLPATQEELRALDAYHRYNDASTTTVREANEDEGAYQRRLLDRRAQALLVERDQNEDDRSFGDRVNAAATTVRDGSRAVRDRITSAASDTGDGLSSAASATGHHTKRSVDGARQFHEENPLVSGALSFAIGSLLGSAFPVTDKEYDLAKGPADEAIAKGARGVRDAAERTQEAMPSSDRTARSSLG